MTVYGKAGMVASQLPLEMPRDALLVELVCLATERAAAALRDNAAATGADAPQDPQLVVFRDTAFGAKKELNAEDDGLIKLEDLGFEYGEPQHSELEGAGEAQGRTSVQQQERFCRAC